MGRFGSAGGLGGGGGAGGGNGGRGGGDGRPGGGPGRSGGGGGTHPSGPSPVPTADSDRLKTCTVLGLGVRFALPALLDAQCYLKMLLTCRHACSIGTLLAFGALCGVLNDLPSLFL